MATASRSVISRMMRAVSDADTPVRPLRRNGRVRRAISRAVWAWEAAKRSFSLYTEATSSTNSASPRELTRIMGKPIMPTRLTASANGFAMTSRMAICRVSTITPVMKATAGSNGRRFRRW